MACGVTNLLRIIIDTRANLASESWTFFVVLEYYATPVRNFVLILKCILNMVTK